MVYHARGKARVGKAAREEEDARPDEGLDQVGIGARQRRRAASRLARRVETRGQRQRGRAMATVSTRRAAAAPIAVPCFCTQRQDSVLSLSAHTAQHNSTPTQHTARSTHTLPPPHTHTQRRQRTMATVIHEGLRDASTSSSSCSSALLARSSMPADGDSSAAFASSLLSELLMKNLRG